MWWNTLVFQFLSDRVLQTRTCLILIVIIVVVIFVVVFHTLLLHWKHVKKRRNGCADRGKFGFLYIYKPDGGLKQRLRPGSVWKCHRKGFLERGWTFEFIVELFLLLLLPVGCIMNERFLRRTSADAIDQKENEEHCRKWDVESDEMDESHRGSHTNSAQAMVGSK